jgi:hypothetical protein
MERKSAAWIDGILFLHNNYLVNPCDFGTRLLAYNAFVLDIKGLLDAQKVHFRLVGGASLHELNV